MPILNLTRSRASNPEVNSINMFLLTFVQTEPRVVKSSILEPAAFCRMSYLYHFTDAYVSFPFFPDSYPKVTFSIGNKIIKTKKGPLHHGSRDPLYNESFNFSVSGDDLGSGTLLVSIMHSRGGGKEDQLVGRVLLGGMMYARGTECEHWTEMMTNPRNMIKYWHKLTS